MTVQPRVSPGKSREETRPVQAAAEGVGPLLQRDFVAVLEGSRLTPEEIVWAIRREFPGFAPKALASFTRSDGEERPLEVGDTMHVFMPGGGHSGVVAAHMDERSLTLRTQCGHFEAGMITFGADYDEAGRVVFRIRSRATIERPVRLVMYWAGGKPLQTRIWTTFAARVAEAAGAKVRGGVLCSTMRTRHKPVDNGVVDHPTFTADRGTPASPHNPSTQLTRTPGG